VYKRQIYNNLMIRGGLKLREGFRRKAWNNIILNNGLSSHVWFNNSKDSVTGNIMARCNNPYVVGDVDVSHLVDKNFYYQADQASLERVQNKSNWDHNSLFGDAMFVDPENGDFRVKEGSPAFEIGFKNFPMDQFGVKKPSLKAIARTPEIPYSNPKKQAASSVQPAKPLSITWLGGTLTALKGEEFSAYGVKKKDGGVAIRGLKEGATALKYGIQDNDLVQGINGKKVSTVEQFIAAVANPEAKTLELKLVRNQQAASATVPVKTITEYETIFSQKSFTHPSIDTSKKVVANINLANSGADTLTDGKLADDFGAVFSNGVTEGMFRMDLGKVSNVQSITSWAFKKGSSRGDQKITIFASAADKPGWDLTKYEELGLIDTSNQDNLNFSQATLKSSNSKSLGQYRWILWKAYPISPVGENTSFQEFAVETK